VAFSSQAAKGDKDTPWSLDDMCQDSEFCAHLFPFPVDSSRSPGGHLLETGAVAL